MKFLTVFVALLSVAFGYQADWTLQQLSEALENPATDPALLPYLEHALNQIMTDLFNGVQAESVAVAIPAGLLPIESPIAPIPVGLTPVPVNPSPSPSAPVALPAAPASALVQIIVNVNKEAAPAIPAPVVTPQVPKPHPVIVVDEAEPVAAIPINPVDVIAVAAPEINPVDLLHPVISPAGASAPVVGPIV